MTAYADLIGRRFGDGGPSCDGAPDNEFIRRVLSRKTVRRYSDAKPEENLLDLLVAAALSASAKSDFQQSSILRISDPAKRAAIGALFPKMPWIGVSPVFFIFLGDARRLQRIGELRGKPAAGLGVCPISVIRNEVGRVASILELPDLVFPVVGLCLGYPQADGHISLRLPRAVTTHRDRYDDSRLPQAIDDYDRRRDSAHVIPKDQHRANAKFGEANFYGWSEDKARQAADAEGAAFPPHLRSHGFTLD
jgi:nitroreductase